MCIHMKQVSVNNVVAAKSTDTGRFSLSRVINGSLELMFQC